MMSKLLWNHNNERHYQALLSLFKYRVFCQGVQVGKYSHVGIHDCMVVLHVRLVF
nr:MAG TPA: hypothetical protein [Caudoviricetes sp.]